LLRFLAPDVATLARGTAASRDHATRSGALSACARARSYGVMLATLVSLSGRAIAALQVERDWTRSDVLEAAGAYAASEYRLFCGSVELTDDEWLEGIGFADGGSLLLVLSTRPRSLLVAGCCPLPLVEEWGLDLSTRREVADGNGGIVNDIDYSPDGEWIVTARGDGKLSRWQRATGERYILATCVDPVTAVAYHPLGASVALVIRDYEVRAVQAESGALYFREKDHAPSTVRALASGQGCCGR